MRTIAGIGGATRRRRPIRRFLIITVILLLLIEPLFMYRVLVRERAQRRMIAESSLVAPFTPAVKGQEAGRRTE
jgi:ABC-type taurine transport system ATPase subunit